MEEGSIEMAGAAKEREIILEATGAGIKVTLYGVRVKGGKWRFLLDNDEGTMADFLDEEDADVLPKLRTKSEFVDTWDKALALLNRYPWRWFVPKEVHPEFRDLVWSAVQAREPKEESEGIKRHIYEGWKRFLALVS
jgi:hypothetical protein